MADATTVASSDTRPSLSAQVRGFFASWNFAFWVVAMFWIPLLTTLIGRPVLGRRAAIWFGRRCLNGASTQVTVSGLDGLPLDEGMVLLCNHESHWDGMVLVGSVERPLTFVAKRELFKIPVMGWGFKGLGFIPLDREAHQAAIAGLSVAGKAIERGEWVVVYPEGHRSENGELGAFKTGGVLTAIGAQAPIVPVGIAGTRQIIAPGEILVKPGRVHVVFGEPIPTVGLGADQRKMLNAKVRQAILALRAEARKRLDAELEST